MSTIYSTKTHLSHLQIQFLYTEELAFDLVE